MPNWWSGVFEFLQNSTLGLRYARLKMLSQNMSLLPHFSFSFDGYPLWQASLMARRGAIDPGPFSTAREFPADDFRHWKCLKSPFQAWLIRVQSSHTIWHFWAIFGRTSSFYWFSLFLLPLSRFWLIPFKPLLFTVSASPFGLDFVTLDFGTWAWQYFVLFILGQKFY